MVFYNADANFTEKKTYSLSEWKRKFESQMPSESKDTKQSVCKRSTVTFTELLFHFAESS